MVEFLSPGVKVQEKKSSAQAVSGVSTSNFATVGWLKRGPENKATLVGSLQEFLTKFGDYWDKSDVPDAVTAFFNNGGARAYIVRVTPSDAVAASVTAASNLWMFTAKSKGAWGNLLRVSLRGNELYYNQATATYSRYDLVVSEESSDGAADFGVVETFTALDLTNDSGEFGILTVVNDSQSGSDLISVSKLTGGVPAAFASTAVTAESIGTGDGNPTQTITGTLAGPPCAPYTLKIKVDGTIEAQDNGRGTISAVSGSAFAITGTINYATGEYSITFTPGVDLADAITADYYTAGVAQIDYDLINGAEGTEVTRAQVSNPALAADTKGLYALDAVDEILNIGLPDFSGDVAVHTDLIAYCETRKDCFAILDAAAGADYAQVKQYKLNDLGSQSSYAALYWPHINVADNTRGGRPKLISPVGHIAGVYARTDNTRNVGKAPAGTVDGAIAGSLSLEFDPTKAMQDAVYPANINPLINTALTGRVVWGVRTLQLVGDFDLVNVRRLFMFLEKSLYNASQDLVFETIGDELFARTKLRFDGFLSGLTQEGYFGSRDPAQAFRVTCDRTNNPNAEATKKLIADILVAPQVPAEFVLLRFERSLGLIGA